MTVEIDIQRVSDAPEQPAAKKYKKWVKAALSGHRQQAELTIRLVDEAESRQLNREYRGRDKATNVLSFPLDAPAYVDSHLLGDLVICAPLVRREAQEQGKSVEAHWAHLVVHGILHLLGMDHQADREAREMERLEVEILARLGIPDPYTENESA